MEPSSPSYMWIPEGSTFASAEETIDLARALGQDVDQPEVDSLRTLMAETPDGAQFAGFGSAIVCGRQNIKTWAIRQCVIYDAFIRGVPRVTFSAHLFKTTRDSFKKIDELVESFDWLRQAVRKASYANGEEGFELRNGCRIDFVARSLRGSRGLGADTVVLDEWLFGTGEMLGALVPTMSTALKPHILYGSSPGLRTSEALRDLRERGRPGGDATLTYIEWTSPREGCDSPSCAHKAGKAEGCELDNEARWLQANPALGRRITVDYVRKERAEIPVTEFMRERMGWWEDPAETSEGENFPVKAWDERLDATSKVATDSPIALAVDTSWDRKTTWISAAGDRTDGRLHAELLIGGPGTDWVIPWFLERRAKYQISAIGLQGSGAPVSSLLEPLREALGVDLVKALGVQEIGRACGAFYDGVSSGLIAHIGQEQLEDGVRLAAVRPIGDAWVVDRKASPVDVAPLVSAIEAAYLAKTVTYEPPRKRSAPRRIR